MFKLYFSISSQEFLFTHEVFITCFLIFSLAIVRWEISKFIRDLILLQDNNVYEYLILRYRNTSWYLGSKDQQKQQDISVWNLCMTLLHQMSFYFIPSCFCQGPSRDMHNLNNIIIFKNTEWDMSIIFTMVLNCLMSLKYVCVAHWYVCSTCIYV